MKKLIILSLFLTLFTLGANAQISFDTTYHENLNVDANDFDYRYVFVLTNDSIDHADTNFTWELTYVDMPVEWEYIVGFDLYCGFFPPVTTGSLVIPNNAQDRARMYFTMYGTPGAGTLHMRITSKLNPANSDSIVFKINALDLAYANRPKLLNFSVYPNPTSDYLTIQTEPEAHYSLTNLQGQVVKEGTLVSSFHKIDMQDLSKGTYVLKVIHEGKVGVRKVVVE